MFKESKLRSIIKSLSWRLLATLTTILIVYIFVGDPKIAFSIGGIEKDIATGIKLITQRLDEKQAWDFEGYRKRYSWSRNADITRKVYLELLNGQEQAGADMPG